MYEEGESSVRRTSEKSKKTKAHILQSTVDVIMKEGVEKISINKVVKAAAVSKGGFYYYFTDVDELIKEAFMYSLNQSIEGFQLEGESLEDCVKQFGRYLIRSVQEQADDHAMMFLFISKCFQDQKFKAEFQNMKQHILEENVLSKQLLVKYPVHPELLQALDMMILGFIVHCMFEQSEELLLSVWDRMVERLLDE
ncbi:hypothetical protein CD798_05230 [Bacillaceae bacterium SAOS 7]|nr:hypothetical protein CD798_05230 [Bacillaceae bacterium SAOS 7]